MINTEMALRLLTGAIVLLICMPVHEFAHALAASRMGDTTAKEAGRVTLNPLKHLDPLGSIMMLASAVAGMGFGWAKPVPVNASRFRNPRLGMGLTAAAGPISNLIMAWLGMVFYKIIGHSYTFHLFGGGAANPVAEGAMTIFTQFILLNVGLAVFNLLPVPPFDGSRILLMVLPEKAYFGVMKYERYIMFGIMGLLMFGILSEPLRFFNGWALKLMDWATFFVDMAAEAVWSLG